MSFDGRAVANFILDVCEQHGRRISNLALQKILFFCHARFLTDLGKPLIRHDFEAWQFGPVLQYVYREFKDFDAMPISRRAMATDRESGEKRTVGYSFDEEAERLLIETIQFYSRMSAGALVELSHVKGGPWDEVWNHESQINPGMKISNDRILNYYQQAKRPHHLQ
ncbi:type II toxin-antitoxin system antitoxin SocA domain-containing protein [Iodidimonas sp. SYSU 1G8]|uniref:Panacea domain-containing protein n=1 Tax=Iodidimonas sp. SYSU 1G8 TaxID=3133967 RepID=UPI0031FEE0D8